MTMRKKTPQEILEHERRVKALTCIDCGTETISCQCGGNRYCPNDGCHWRIVSFPCRCPGGVVNWNYESEARDG